MKKLVFILCTCCLYVEYVQSATRTAISNVGTGWSTASNWSPSGVPQSGDVAIIPAGITLNVNGIVYSNTPNLVVTIYGKLRFEPSGKLFLGTNSYVQIQQGGSILSNGTSSEVIKIGGVTKYIGNINGDLSGPLYADSNTGAVPDGFIYGTLPVSITDFAVSQASSKKIILKWVSKEELNIENYIVEKSPDGITWDCLDSMSPRNDRSASENNYVFTDPFPGAVNFYRIKAVELSKKVIYSEIKSIRLPGKVPEKIFTSYPNPVTDRIFFDWKTDAVRGTIKIYFYNSDGRLVLEKSFDNRIAANNIYLGNLKKGTYLLRVSDERSYATEQIILK